MGTEMYYFDSKSITLKVVQNCLKCLKWMKWYAIDQKRLLVENMLKFAPNCSKW